MADTVAFKYRAFISYSHADTSWAKWLHRALEGFRIDKDLVGRQTATGTIPRNLRSVFRDRDDFTAGHTLNDQTLMALDASHALIVICSPSAAKSGYVAEEIRLFKSRHPERPVIPLIVDGKPGDADLECFPPSLKFKLTAKGTIGRRAAELLAADARDDGDGKNLALAKVVAGLLGVSSDDIYRRAERERRRRGRVRNGLVAVLAFLAVAAAGSALYAWQQLKTNEAFLDATLDRFTRLVDRSVSLAQGYSVPLAVTLGLLQEAEGMLDVMATYGRETPKLKYRKVRMLRAFADNYRDLGQTGEWQSRIEEAQPLMTELTVLDPTNLDWSYEKALIHRSAGDLLSVKGDLSGALREYQAKREIVFHLTEADPSNADWQHDLSLSYERVGDVRIAQGDLTAALNSYRDSLGIVEKLAEAEPKNEEWQRDLSVSYSKIGNVLAVEGKLTAALDAYRDSLAIFERQAETDPGNAGWQHDLSVSYSKIGDVQMVQGDFAAALKVYRKSHAILDRLAKADPDFTGAQRDLSVSYDKIGDVQKARGDLAAALEAYRDGLGIKERLAEADRSNTLWQRDLSISYERIGDVRMAQGNRAAALKIYRDSLGIAESLAAADPKNAGWQRRLAVSHFKVAAIIAEQGDVREAIDRYRQARDIVLRLIEQSPDNATLSSDLAWYEKQIAELEGAHGSDAPSVPGHDTPGR